LLVVDNAVEKVVRYDSRHILMRRIFFVLMIVQLTALACSVSWWLIMPFSFIAASRMVGKNYLVNFCFPRSPIRHPIGQLVLTGRPIVTALENGGEL